MTFVKLFCLCLFILLSNRLLIRVDYSKIFKKNSTREIYFFNMIISVVLGYLLYEAIFTMHELSISISNMLLE